MSVTVPTKDIGDVRDRRCKNAEFKTNLEDRNEKYIKQELRIE